jgi:CBS domain-containing protein
MQDWSTRTAGEVMTSPVLALSQQTTLKEAIELMSDNEVRCAPVIDQEGVPLGVVSLTDIAAFIAGLEREMSALGGFYFHAYPLWDRANDTLGSNIATEEGDQLDAAQVEEVMTPDVISVSAGTPLPEVVDLMTSRHIHRVLVLEGGRVQGIVSTMDILGALRSVAAESAAG